MAKDLFNRYVWIVDTIRRHNTITRSELNDRWKRSPFSNGEALPRRTFYNYRNAIEEIFGIRIQFNPTTYEYSIENDDHSDDRTTNVTDWILNSASMSNVMADMSAIADKVFLEDVPSARLYLAPILQALRECHTVRFSYHPYTRSLPTPGVEVQPYFIKIFRQRWYLTGLNLADNRIKTYALDRMSEVNISTDTFTPPEYFDAADFVRDSFGIVFSHGRCIEWY